jgi:hypothetical protein
MKDHRFTAGCLCGKVRLVTDAEPLRVGICHCLDCRKQYGGVMYVFAVFPTTAVAVTGETSRYRFRHFCPECGSSVFDERDSEIEISAGSFDAENVVQPTYETWICRREKWLPIFPVEHRHERDRT